MGVGTGNFGVALNLQLQKLRGRVVFLILLIVALPSLSIAATYDESMEAARAIARWLTSSSSHQDFLSATPTGVLRAGDKFFVKEKPIQTASDYGYSFARVPVNDEVVRAYEKLGLNLSASSRIFSLSRIHATWSFANAHDFSLSYLHSNALDGFGVGYKNSFWQSGPLYVAYRFGMSLSQRNGFFIGQSFTNEIGASLYFKIVDFYAGLRHSFGWSEFDASVPALQLPTVYYFSDFSQIEALVGVVVATTTETRLALQLTHRENELSLAAKFSFRFDALHPTYNDWFRDPRRLKQ